MHFKAHIELNAQTSVNSSSEKPRSIVTITHFHHAGLVFKINDIYILGTQKLKHAWKNSFAPDFPHGYKLIPMPSSDIIQSENESM